MPAEPAADLPAAITVPALVRQAEAAGGFAALLHRGGPGTHVFLVVRRLPGRPVAVFERLPAIDRGVHWHCAAEGEAEVDSFIVRQRRFDPDLWVVELAGVDPARFIPAFPPMN
jgi:hypothetical protein